jgi:hypothetical protein
MKESTSYGPCFKLLCWLVLVQPKSQSYDAAAMHTGTEVQNLGNLKRQEGSKVLYTSNVDNQPESLVVLVTVRAGGKIKSASRAATARTGAEPPELHDHGAESRLSRLDLSARSWCCRTVRRWRALSRQSGAVLC